MQGGSIAAECTKGLLVDGYFGMRTMSANSGCGGAVLAIVPQTNLSKCGTRIINS